MGIIYSKEFRKLGRVISWLLFIIYLFILINVLFFDIRYGRVAGSGIKSYNLVPFKTINNYIKYRRYVSDTIIITNIFGNILAFMPFGFFVPLLLRWTRCFVTAIFLSGLMSFLVEVIQYKYAVGSFDVDDIILNTLGGFIGYIIYKICYYVYNGIKHTTSKK